MNLRCTSILLAASIPSLAACTGAGLSAKPAEKATTVTVSGPRVALAAPQPKPQASWAQKAKQWELLGVYDQAAASALKAYETGAGNGWLLRSAELYERAWQWKRAKQLYEKVARSTEFDEPTKAKARQNRKRLQRHLETLDPVRYNPHPGEEKAWALARRLSSTELLEQEKASIIEDMLDYARVSADFQLLDRLGLHFWRAGDRFRARRAWTRARSGLDFLMATSTPEERWRRRPRLMPAIPYFTNQELLSVTENTATYLAQGLGIRVDLEENRFLSHELAFEKLYGGALNGTFVVLHPHAFSIWREAYPSAPYKHGSEAAPKYTCAAISADASLAAAGDEAGGVVLHTEKTTQRFPTSVGSVTALAISNGERRLIAVAGEYGLVIVNAAGKQMAKLAPNLAVSLLRFSPDDRILAVAGPGELVLFESASGKELRRLTFPASPSEKDGGLPVRPISIEFYPDDEHLEVALETGVQIVRWRDQPLVESHDFAMGNLASFHRTAQRIVTTESKRDAILLWDPETKEQVGSFRLPVTFPTVALSPQRSALADGKNLFLSDTHLSKRPVRLASEITKLRLSADGSKLAVQLRSGRIELRAADSLRIFGTALGDTTGSMGLSGNGKHLAYSAKGRIYIASMPEFELRGFDGQSFVLGQAHVVLQQDGTSRLFRIESGRPVAQLGHGEPLALAPDDETVALRDATELRIVHARRGELLSDSFEGPITSAAFSPSSFKLAVAHGSQITVVELGTAELISQGDETVHPRLPFTRSITWLSESVFATTGSDITKIWRVDGKETDLKLVGILGTVEGGAPFLLASDGRTEGDESIIPYVTSHGDILSGGVIWHRAYTPGLYRELIRGN